MRLFLEGAEVWCGLTFLRIVSAEWLAGQVQERLQYIATTEWLRGGKDSHGGGSWRVLEAYSKS